MINFLVNNIGTIIVSLIILIIVSLIIIKLVRDKKNGKSSCGCGCENCPNAGICHKTD